MDERSFCLKITWFQDCSPFETDTSHPLVQQLADVAEEVTGKRVINGMSAGCDARHFYQRSTCPDSSMRTGYLP